MPKPISDVIKKNVRSVLVSNPKGVSLNELLKDYEKLLYVKLNFSALGYRNLVEFLHAMPDVAKLEWWPSKQTHRIFAVVDAIHYLPTFLKGNTKQLNGFAPPTEPTRGYEETPVVPLSQLELWEEKLSPNRRGQYAVCFLKQANHTREEISDDFGTVGEVAETTFTNRYNSKEKAMAALETLEYKYHASPPDEGANPHHVFKMKDAYQKPMKRQPTFADSEIVEIYVGALARETSAEEVLRRIEPNLVYQYHDVQKEDKHFMFLFVKRESVDKVIASLHHKFIGGNKIIAQLAFAYEDNAVNNKDHSLDMKAAIDTKVVKGHLGVFHQFDYEQASSIEDVETCSFDTNGEHDWPGPPLPDLEPALPELEPVMPELEPAMPDLEPVYDYDPTARGLLGASPQQMAYGQSPNSIQPMHQMAKRKRNVHSNTGSQSMHQDQLQVNQSSTNHRRIHQWSSKKNSEKSAIPQVAHSNRKIRKVAANCLSNGQHRYLPMCDEQALLGGFLEGSAIVHLANFDRETTWPELMEVFKDLKPLRIEVDSSSLDDESTYAAMIMKSVMDADAALSYNNMTLKGRTLFVYRSESVKSMEEGDAEEDVEMEGDADILGDIPTSLKVKIKNTRVRDANGDEAEDEGSWMEQQIVSRFVRAVGACCPDCELWTPADLTSTAISIAITGVIDDTYISGQVIDIATREEHKWLSDMFPLMQMEDAQMMYTLGSKTCAALYEGEWFRGYVEEVKFDTASVFAIDYGNVVKQPVKNLRDFPVVLWEVTAQAWPIKVVSSVFDNLQQLDQMKVHAEVLNPDSMTFPLNVHITGIVEEEEEEDTAADNPGTSSAASLRMRSAMRSGLSRPQPAKRVKFASLVHVSELL